MSALDIHNIDEFESDSDLTLKLTDSEVDVPVDNDCKKVSKIVSLHFVAILTLHSYVTINYNSLFLFLQCIFY